MSDTVWAYLPSMLSSLARTFQLVGLTLVLSTVLALLLTPLAVSDRLPIRLPVKAYSWIGRALPPLTLLFATFYGLSAAGIAVPALIAATVAFTFFTTAYNLEIFRAGYQAVPRGQFEAARALGVPPVRQFFQVIGPQMIPIVVPAFLGNATTVLKDSALASIVGVVEITATTRFLVQAEPGDALLLYGLLGAVYLVLCSVLIGAQHWLERRFHNAGVSR